MRDFVRKPRNWFAVCIVLCFLFALIYSFISSSQTNLPSYVPTNEPVEEDEETTPDIKTTEYFNDELNLSMLVPADWTEVIKSGCDSFINQVDGAMLQFDIRPYDPTFNNITKETVANDVLAADGVLGGFAKDDNHSYLAIYEIGSTDYFEYNIWDLNHTVRVSMQIPAQRYNDYYDTVIYLFDSFQWDQANPIPEEFILYYSDYGNFEFGVPIGWESSIVDGVYQAVSPSGSMMTCTLTSTSLDLSNVKQLDYVGVASAGKSNYLLSSFSNTGTNLTAEATYNVDGIPYSEVQSILATGLFQYEFTFQCEQANYETDGQYFIMAMNLFRVFD